MLFAGWRHWCETCNINSKIDKPNFSKRLNKLIRENKWEFIWKSPHTSVRAYIIDKEKYKKFIGLDFKEEKEEDTYIHTYTHTYTYIHTGQGIHRSGRNQEREG